MTNVNTKQSILARSCQRHAVIFAIVAAGTPTFVQAATSWDAHYSIGGVFGPFRSGGLWNTAANWSTNTVPTSTDDVVFGTVNSVTDYGVGFGYGSYSIHTGFGSPNTATTSVRSIEFASGSPTLYVSPGSTINVVRSGIALNTTSSGVTAGIGGGGTVNVSDNIRLGLGSIAVSGGATLQSSGWLAFGNGGQNVTEVGFGSTLQSTGSQIEIGEGANSSAFVNVYNGGTLSAGTFITLATQATSTGTLTAYAGGTVNAGTDLHIGKYPTLSAGGAGTVNLNGGTINVNGLTKVYNNASKLNITGGTLKTGSLDVDGVPARLDWSGGTIELTNSHAYVGATGSNRTFGTDHLDFTNNRGLILSGIERHFHIGLTESGTVNQYSGNINMVASNSNFYMGVNSGASGSYNMSDGSLNVGGVWIVGQEGSGTVNASGGSISAGQVWLGRYAGGIGNMNLNISANLTTNRLDIGGSAEGAGGAGSASIWSGATVIVHGPTIVHTDDSIGVLGGSLYTQSLDVSDAANFEFRSGAITVMGGEFKPKVASGLEVGNGFEPGAIANLELQFGSSLVHDSNINIGNHGGIAYVYVQPNSTVSTSESVIIGNGTSGGVTPAQGQGSAYISDSHLTVGRDVSIGLGGGYGNLTLVGTTAKLSAPPSTSLFTSLNVGDGQYVGPTEQVQSTGNLLVEEGAVVEGFSSVSIGIDGGSGYARISRDGDRIVARSQIQIGRGWDANRFRSIGILEVEDSGIVRSEDRIYIGMHGGHGTVSVSSEGAMIQSRSDSFIGIGRQDFGDPAVGNLNVGGGASAQFGTYFFESTHIGIDGGDGHAKCPRRGARIARTGAVR